ncbi:hypothetical protein MKOR_34450 [Mycolicibacillus koreensis]|uniref:Uncharacterized protein n=1 Tax=Mycolicibacillus koreensis TaxID=1069220 RepID=A0A7I7SGZ4_9MYCO|nr:hypothetical protein B8W67_09995 [Mycolicibacillus koreensis]BBY56194.1 hypothetical protein MKOR_34450 [Mycolicibacillus koreensis]
MTLLGGALYAGFFGLAAVWLAWTGERDEPTVQDGGGQPQAADRSNDVRASAASRGSMPC